jgi:hypothetical protein
MSTQASEQQSEGGLARWAMGPCGSVEPWSDKALQHLLFDEAIPEWPISQRHHYADNPLCPLRIVVSDPGKVSREMAQYLGRMQPAKFG